MRAHSIRNNKYCMIKLREEFFLHERMLMCDLFAVSNPVWVC